MSKLLFVLLGSFGLALGGCTDKEVADQLNQTVYAVGSSVDKAKSHVESADNLVTKAVPESNATGKALLSAAKDEHAGAVKELETAKVDVATATTAAKKLETSLDDKTSQLDKVTHSVGYTIEVWVIRLFWLVMAAIAFHIIGGSAAVFIPGPIGAGIGIAAAFVNPLGWFQSIRDNYFFRVVKPKQDAAAIAVTPVTTPATPTPAT